MKKIILGLLAVVIASAGMVSGTVNAGPAHTDVTGVVTDENQNPVAGAMVTVLCNGNTETDTTDAKGSYVVTYLKTQCDFGATVKVTAKKGGKSGIASGTVEGKTTKLNLAIVNVQIPEFGLIGSLLAGGAGIGLIAYSRRRQQQAQY